jgi:ADP-ribose pyrophosphatase
MKPWTTLDSMTLVKDRWISLRADRCRLANGELIAPYYVMEEPDWVHVVPVHDDGRVVLVQQYRHAAALTSIEFPGGIVDAGEQPIVAATRELMEETGFLARDWQPIASFLANPARQTNRVHLFIARGLTRAAAQTLDATEDIACSEASVDEINAMIADGRFSHGLNIASFYLALATMATLPKPEE